VNTGKLGATPRWWAALLILLCAGAILAAVLVTGPGSSRAASQRIVTATRGVVESTVSGSGTLSAPETDVNFASAGTLAAIDAKVGQHVVEGQRLGQIDPADAKIALEQAQANVQSAEAKLAQAEAAQTTTTGSRTPASSSSPSASSSSASESAATKAADIASAQAALDSAQLAETSAQRTLDETTLVAPTAGTVASVTGAVGDSVSGGGTSSSSRTAGSSAGSSGAGSGSGGSGAGAGSSGSGAGAGSSGSSGGSSAFVVLVDRSKMALTVPFSESDIHQLKRGQPATVTVNAIPGLELAAHVSSIDMLPTTNSGVVSYDVTFALDQRDAGLRPGMTATAQVVVSRVQDAVTVPTSAISRRGGGTTVSLWKNGTSTPQPVVTGLAGDNTTQVISGLRAGQQVAIPIATSLGTTGTAGGGLGARAGGGGLGLGLGGGGGGGGFFGGGGGRRSAGPGG
jgi:macrolide-specific efflux system membrane fusion protein